MARGTELAGIKRCPLVWPPSRLPQPPSLNLASWRARARLATLRHQRFVRGQELQEKETRRAGMFEWSINDRHFFIRDAESDSEYHEIEDIQKEAWGFNDL